MTQRQKTDARRPKRNRRDGFPLRGPLLLACVSLVLCATAPWVAAQESWPSRPIHFIVPFSPGTAVDGMARIIGASIGKDLNVGIVVENKEGASGIVGSAYGANAKPDGYTVLMGTQAIVTAIFFTPTMPFDPVRDLAPIVKVGTAPSVMFTATHSRFTNFATLLAEAKARPEALSYAHAGPGSSGHLGGEVIMKAFGFQARGIGYKTQPQAMIDTVTSRVDFAMANVPVARAQLDAGKVRLLGVLTEKRLPDFANLATVKEQGFDVVVTKFRGLAGPKGIPDDIAAQWERAIRQVVASDAYKAEYAKESLVPTVLGRAEARVFTQKVAEDITATLRELGVIK